MLTTSQLATLKAAILADQTAAAFATANNHVAIAAYLNSPGAGLIYRPYISSVELNTAIVWTEYAVLTALAQNAYLAMISPLAIDASSINIRTGLVAIFGTSTVSKANLTALISRTQTKGESVFTVSQVCPVFGYVFTQNDVAQALGS